MCLEARERVNSFKFLSTSVSIKLHKQPVSNRVLTYMLVAYYNFPNDLIEVTTYVQVQHQIHCVDVKGVVSYPLVQLDNNETDWHLWNPPTLVLHKDTVDQAEHRPSQNRDTTRSVSPLLDGRNN